MLVAVVVERKVVMVGGRQRLVEQAAVVRVLALAPHQLLQV
jgi:hypothetical protein